MGEWKVPMEPFFLGSKDPEGFWRQENGKWYWAPIHGGTRVWLDESFERYQTDLGQMH